MNNMYYLGRVLLLALTLLSVPILSTVWSAAREGMSALELARQLNQAFIDVADTVSPAVVVVRIAHKPNYVDPNDEEHPFFDMLPPEFRRRLEEQREKRRKELEDDQRFHRAP